MVWEADWIKHEAKCEAKREAKRIIDLKDDDWTVEDKEFLRKYPKAIKMVMQEEGKQVFNLPEDKQTPKEKWF